MTRLVPATIATALAYVCFDAFWLSLTADPLYRGEMGYLLRDEFDFRPVLVFYPVYIAGIMVFAVMPGLAAQSWAATAWRAALFGLVAYATYDLTNLATLKGWSVMVTAIDLVWGTCLTATAATAGYLAARIHDH